MQLAKSLTSYDILLGLLAAATHDLGHPGVNQPFLIKTDHYLATLYRVRDAAVPLQTPELHLSKGTMCVNELVCQCCFFFLPTEYLSSGKPPLEVGSGPPQRDQAVLSFTC